MTEQEIDRAKAAKAAYMRKWRRENKEKNREYQIHYWSRKLAEMEAGNDGKDITAQGR